MQNEKSTDSGRVHIHRIDGEVPDQMDNQLPTDTDVPEEPTYAVVIHDHSGAMSTKSTTFLANTVNVNGATFATEYAEFGAGGHKRVYRDLDNDGLVRVIVSPKRT